MTAIGPGDWVECVDDQPQPGTRWHWADERVYRGALYRVADCFVNRLGEQSLVLVGVERRRASAEFGYRVGFGVERFRPIYRPKGKELVNDLLRRANEPLRITEAETAVARAGQ